MGLVTQRAKYMPIRPTIGLRAEISKLSIQAAIPMVTVLVGSIPRYPLPCPAALILSHLTRTGECEWQLQYH